MKTRKNFPNRKLNRLKGALDRRTKDIDVHSKSGDTVKMDRAKSDVEALKIKLENKVGLI